MAVRLKKVSNDLAMQPEWAVQISLCQEATQLLIRFTESNSP